MKNYQRKATARFNLEESTLAHFSDGEQYRLYYLSVVVAGFSNVTHSQFPLGFRRRQKPYLPNWVS